MPMSAGSRIGRTRATFGVQPASKQVATAGTFTGSSTSVFVMAGLGLQITPVVTGNVLVNFSGWLTATAVTINEGTILQIAFGTGTPPANNAAATGTLVGEPMQYTNAIALTTAADLRAPIALQSLITGLTLGTTYWIDIQVKAITGTSVVVTNDPVLTAIEMGSGFAVTPPQLSPSTPTTQSLTSGSGATYTTPAGAKWLEVFMVGGGAGGAGASSGFALVAGTNGNTSTFNSVNAAGGTGGSGTADENGAPGAGGTGGTGTATRRQQGFHGGWGVCATGGNSGGAGGGSALGPGALAISQSGSTVGNSASANTGGGGGGAVNTTNPMAGGGGGGGEFVYLIIPNPAATYTYTIGASAAGGVSTTNGGAGGSGFIFVVEHYS